MFRPQQISQHCKYLIFRLYPLLASQATCVRKQLEHRIHAFESPSNNECIPVGFFAPNTECSMQSANPNTTVFISLRDITITRQTNCFYSFFSVSQRLTRYRCPTQHVSCRKRCAPTSRYQSHHYCLIRYLLFRMSIAKCFMHSIQRFRCKVMFETFNRSSGIVSALT